MTTLNDKAVSRGTTELRSAVAEQGSITDAASLTGTKRNLTGSLKCVTLGLNTIHSSRSLTSRIANQENRSHEHASRGLAFVTSQPFLPIVFRVPSVERHE